MTSEVIEEGMFQSDNPITELNRMLIRYDLTPNQSKVYLFLSKSVSKLLQRYQKHSKFQEQKHIIYYQHYNKKELFFQYLENQPNSMQWELKNHLKFW